MQLWPLAPNIPAVIPFKAFSWSASSNTTTGLFPPSSKLTWDKFSAEFFTICLAVSGPPVNAILSTRLWVVKALPQGSPKPVIILITPFGNPALSINFANSKRVTGASSEALITTVFPIARAGASLTAVNSIWEFQGIIAATTPIGILVVVTCISGLSIGTTVPSTLSAKPAK